MGYEMSPASAIKGPHAPFFACERSPFPSYWWASKLAFFLLGPMFPTVLAYATIYCLLYFVLQGVIFEQLCVYSYTYLWERKMLMSYRWKEMRRERENTRFPILENELNHLIRHGRDKLFGWGNTVYFQCRTTGQVFKSNGNKERRDVQVCWEEKQICLIHSEWADNLGDQTWPSLETLKSLAAKRNTKSFWFGKCT